MNVFFTLHFLKLFYECGFLMLLCLQIKMKGRNHSAPGFFFSLISEKIVTHLRVHVASYIEIIIKIIIHE